MSHDETAVAVPLSERWLSLKGHTIDDVKVREDDKGLHVRISSHYPSELEPENDMAITYSNSSFLIPNIEKFVDWLIRNEDLDNAWWFDTFMTEMYEKFQTVTD